MSAAKQLECLARFVREHGFQAIVIDGAVTFAVPYSIDGKHVGYEAFTVRTRNEAREALGY